MSSWSPDFYILNNLLLFQVKSQVEEKEGKNFDVFAAVEFKTQVVAGMNYFIKVQTSRECYLSMFLLQSVNYREVSVSWL